MAETSQTPESAQRSRTRPRIPALDGLRGIAILLVVASHLGVSSLGQLGGPGVTVFFVLSGFLITTVLLAEHDSRGRVRLRRFYRARLLRLAPAFVVMFAAVAALELVLYGAVDYWWAPLLEVGNWVSATQGAQALRLLHHTWSLGIEEQFYLIWPLVLIALVSRWGYRGIVAVSAAGMVGSLATTIVLEDSARTAYGTDTNAFNLLAGCLLAGLTMSGPRKAPPFILALGLALIASGSWTGSPVATAALGTVLTIWSATTREHRLMTARPLVAAGTISYGWYLWDYPLSVLVFRSSGPMLVVPLVSLVIAVLSWKFIEQPFLRIKRQLDQVDDVSVKPVPVSST